MNVDARGVTRGCCKVQGCSCSSYAGTSTGGMKCDKCGHPPGRHDKSSMTVPKSSVAAPAFQVGNQESSLSSDSDDEATSEPVAVTLDSLPASILFQKVTPPPRDVRPTPLQAWMLQSDVQRPPPRVKKRSRSPLLPIATCRYPNCDKEAFFDLNTRDESVYCSKHISVGPPIDMDTEHRLSAQFDHVVRDGHTDMMVPLQYELHTVTIGDTSHAPLHRTPSTPQHHQPMPQPLMSPHAQLHPSQSLPQIAFPPPFQLPPAAPITQPLPATAPLLPDGIRCKYPQCKKRRFQEDSGKMHEFCGRFHAREFGKLGNQGGAAAIPAGMKCKTPNCTRSRRAREDGDGYYDFCGKSCRDGSYTTSQSAVGEPCNLPGCNKPKYVDPANGRVHDYCGRTHANQAQAAGIAPPVCTIKQLSFSEMAQVQAHFKKEWASGKGSCPAITCVFQVTNPGLEKRWNAYKQRLPSHLQTEEKYFHGTKLTCDIVNTCAVCSDKSCGICGISKLGMYRECIRKNINFQRFGHGFYFAPNSSKCHDYTQGIQTHRAMLLVDILPGKKHVILTTNQELRGPPDGCHSVFGKPGQSLNYPELVVYNPDCVMPRYIIVYVSNGVHKIAK